MTDFLDKNSVLVLNSLYQPIGTVSPKKALVAMNSASEGVPAAKAVDLRYAKLEDGKFDLDTVETFYAYTFEEWLLVDFREGLDRAIHTSKMDVRCPTVIMTNYSKMPMRKFRPTKALLYEMQKGMCGYSGKQLPMKRMNLEHKRCRCDGGRDTFENLMLVETELNSERSNTPLEQWKYKPLFNHKEPKPIPAAYTIKSSVHPDWNYFLKEKV